MKSFFNKIGNQTNDVKFYLKYNIPFVDGLVVYFNSGYFRKYLDKLPEILIKSNELHIYGWQLNYLPNNIDNQRLKLKIYCYDGKILPENWNIEEISLTFFGDYKKFLHKSFKVKKIHNMGSLEIFYI